MFCVCEQEHLWLTPLCEIIGCPAGRNGPGAMCQLPELTHMVRQNASQFRTEVPHSQKYLACTGPLKSLKTIFTAELQLDYLHEDVHAFICCVVFPELQFPCCVFRILSFLQSSQQSVLKAQQHNITFPRGGCGVHTVTFI